jgi:hypothetical protein
MADSGSGLIGRANKGKSSLKRKYTDVSEMLAKNTNAGKDEFKNKIKIMKRQATLKDRK